METKRFIRKNNRLPNKEIYQKNHWYYVTICVQDRICVLEMVGKSVEENLDSPFETDCTIENGQLNSKYSNNGELKFAATLSSIVKNTLFELPLKFSNIVIDEWVIMPNHVHFVIGFDGEPISKSSGKPTELSKIIKYFKSISAINIKKLVEENLDSQFQASNYGQPINDELKFVATTLNTKHFWQKSYYDHVIRDRDDLERIREYIMNNPVQWELDILNPDNTEEFRKKLIALD